MWAWFVGTRIGRWIVGIALTLAGLAAALAVAFVKGKHAQADTDKAKDAQAAQRAAQAAQDTQQAASDAADKVRQDAAKQPAPDTKNRTDFDNEF
jgi:hypothetical protein